MQRDDYTVGYGKPPKHSQFKKGQSGNPSGRPKGRKNKREPFVNRMLREIFVNDLSETIRVVQNGEEIHISKLKGIISQLNNKSLSGDLKAIEQSLSVLSLVSELDDEEYLATYKYNTQMEEYKREHIAKSVSCPIHLARETVQWKVLEKYSNEKILRDMFGEEEIPYGPYSPRNEEDWRLLREDLRIKLEEIMGKHD